ncbi:putative BTB/POZ domain-containing protein [Septoria linicola]|nr:putative BTB/POZ domain-containing protein [Septoria linicola]
MAMAALGTGLDYLDHVSSEQVTILVGKEPEPTRFSAPRAMLCGASKWFETALNNLKEGQEGIVQLLEEIPRAFARFLSWLYRKHCSLPIVDTVVKDDVEVRSHLVQECIEMWNLGDMLVLPELQNKAIDKICLYLFDEIWLCTLSVEAQATAFLETKSHSPMRKLVADYIVQDLQRTRDYTIQKFLGDHEGLLEALLEAQTSLHTSAKGDFPRYLKPYKQRALLYTPVNDKDSYQRNLASHCHDCGYNTTCTPLCSVCKRQKCSCAGEPEWLFLCEDCGGDHTE